MTRTLPEWVGKSPDSAIPPRVKIRLFERAKGLCECCTRKISAADKWDADHKIALVNGGLNRETNLQVLCEWCHKAKTKQDVKAKSKTAKVKAKHFGITKPKQKIQSRGFGQYQDNTKYLDRT